MGSKTVVPIRFIDRQGRPSSPHDPNPSDSIPVMDVIIHGATGASVRHVALVDTGADCNSFSADTAVRLEITPHRSVTETNSVGGAQATGLYECRIEFVGSSLIITTDASAWPSGSIGQYFGTIIGRLALRLGTLVMDYPGNRFEWVVPIPAGDNAPASE